MDLKIIELVDKLGESIKKENIYKEFIEIENVLNASDEVKILSYKKDIAIMNYEDALSHYDKNSQEVLDASKRMSEAIYALNQNEIVTNYNEKLAKLNDFLKEVSKELFGEIYDKN